MVFWIDIQICFGDWSLIVGMSFWYGVLGLFVMSVARVSNPHKHVQI